MDGQELPVRGGRLDETKVALIKRDLRNGRKQAAIAVQYRVTQAQVSHINTGRSWKHVRAAT